jgi:hypothetical protein
MESLMRIVLLPGPKCGFLEMLLSEKIRIINKAIPTIHAYEIKLDDNEEFILR